MVLLKESNKIMNKTELLKVIETKISLKNEVIFDPKEYYKDHKGLWVSSSFESRIRDNAKEVEAGKEFTIASFMLNEYAADEAIEATLPKEHVFDQSDICVIIAAMIAKQPKDETGDLLATGDWNIFYTEACVVFLRWDAGLAEWDVSTWDRGDSVWDAGSRVFSPVN